VHNRKEGERALLRRLQQLVRGANFELIVVHVDPHADPRYKDLVTVESGHDAMNALPRHSPHNLRFFVLSDMLATGRFMCKYCLLTDVTDVRVLTDPFAVMAGGQHGDDNRGQRA
jgi:hypothetical protein